jgi:hypothetical protein
MAKTIQDVLRSIGVTKTNKEISDAVKKSTGQKSTSTPIAMDTNAPAPSVYTAPAPSVYTAPAPSVYTEPKKTTKKTVSGTFGGGSTGLPLTTVYSDGSQSVSNNTNISNTNTNTSGSSSDFTPVMTDNGPAYSPVNGVGTKDRGYTYTTNGWAKDNVASPVTTTAPEMTLEQFSTKLKELGIMQTPVADTTQTDLRGLIQGESDLDTQIAQGEADLLAIKKELAKPETDEQLRARLTALFQQEIDAFNGVYAQKKQEALTAGMGALGTNRAQQARFGLLGSSFGTAETQGVEKQNLQNVDAVETARQDAISPIYTKISDEMLKAKKEKQTAQIESVEAYIANLKSQKEKKTTIATNAVKALIASKATPTDKDFTDMAKQIGVDPALFKQEYLAAKQEEDVVIAKATKAEAKAEAEAEKLALENYKLGKDISTPVSVGGYIWEYNDTSGAMEKIERAQSVAGTGNNTEDGDLTPSQKADALNWLLTQPDVTQGDIDSFNSDRTARALVYNASQQ